MARLNKSKPFGTCSGLNIAAFYQDGRYFDHEGAEVTEEGNPIEVAGVAAEPVAETKEISLEPVVSAEPVAETKEISLEPVVEPEGLNSVDYSTYSFQELKAASRAAGGPVNSKKAALAFLNSL